jgi:hypothetical protein
MAHLIPNNSIPSVTQIKPKPIFVMRFRNSMSDEEQKNVSEIIYKSDMNNEYHIIVLKNDKDKDEFEMYNADKIERQDWNTIVNKLKL